MNHKKCSGKTDIHWSIEVSESIIKQNNNKNNRKKKKNPTNSKEALCHPPSPDLPNDSPDLLKYSPQLLKYSPHLPGQLFAVLYG